MNDMKECTVIDVLRHGQCEGGEIYRGTTDVLLTQTGTSQMHEAVSNHSGWDQIISSPLRRCAEFATSLSEQLSTPIAIDDRWREIDFGEWEGREVKEVWQSNKELVSQYYSQPGTVTPIGGENIKDVQDRVVAAFNRAAIEYKHQHILVVQHGGTIRLLLAHLMQSPLTAITRIEVAYASLTRIKVYHQQEKLLPVITGHYPGFSIE